MRVIKYMFLCVRFYMAKISSGCINVRDSFSYIRFGCLIFVIFSCFARGALATDWYVRSNSTTYGSGNGSDWNTCVVWLLRAKLEFSLLRRYRLDSRR